MANKITLESIAASNGHMELSLPDFTRLLTLAVKRNLDAKVSLVAVDMPCRSRLVGMGPAEHSVSECIGAELILEHGAASPPVKMTSKLTLAMADVADYIAEELAHSDPDFKNLKILVDPVVSNIANDRSSGAASWAVTKVIVRFSA